MTDEKDLDATKEESPPDDGPSLPDDEETPDGPELTEAAPPTLAPEVEAAFRKIAKEEIGKALGHTVV